MTSNPDDTGRGAPVDEPVGYLAFQEGDGKGVFFPTMVHMTAGTLRWCPPVSRVVPLYARANLPPPQGDADKVDAERQALELRADRQDDLLHKIESWCKAYPLDVFPEPDFKRAHEVLSAAGMTLDAISASNMRHVVTQIAKMIGAAGQTPGGQKP